MKTLMALAMVCLATMAFAVPPAELLPADSDAVVVVNFAIKGSPMAAARVDATSQPVGTRPVSAALVPLPLGLGPSAVFQSVPAEIKKDCQELGIDLEKDITDLTIAFRFVDLKLYQIDGVVFVGGTFDTKKIFPALVEKYKQNAKLEGDAVVLTDFKGEQYELGMYPGGLYLAGPQSRAAMKARLAGTEKGLPADSKLAKLLTFPAGQVHVAGAIAPTGMSKIIASMPETKPNEPDVRQPIKELTEATLVLNETPAPALALTVTLNTTSEKAAEQVMQEVLGVEMLLAMAIANRGKTPSGLTKILNSTQISHDGTVVNASLVADLPTLMEISKDLQQSQKNAGATDAPQIRQGGREVQIDKSVPATPVPQPLATAPAK